MSRYFGSTPTICIQHGSYSRIYSGLKPFPIVDGIHSDFLLTWDSLSKQLVDDLLDKYRSSPCPYDFNRNLQTLSLNCNPKFINLCHSSEHINLEPSNSAPLSNHSINVVFLECSNPQSFYNIEYNNLYKKFAEILSNSALKCQFFYKSRPGSRASKSINSIQNIQYISDINVLYKMTRNSIFVSGDCSLCWELRSLGAIVLGICHPSFEDKTISKFPDYIYQYTFTKKTMTDEHIPNILQSFYPPLATNYFK